MTKWGWAEWMGVAMLVVAIWVAIYTASMRHP